MKRLTMLFAAAALLAPAGGAQEPHGGEKAHLWVYVQNNEWGSVDVSASPANDIGQMELTVTLYAGGRSHDFDFLQPLFADNPPVTSEAHLSPAIKHTQVTAASARVGGMWKGYRSMKCGEPKRERTRTVFACNYRKSRP